MKSTDFAKRLMSMSGVLMLMHVLFITSCVSSKRGTATVSTSSEINKDVRVQVDSLARVGVEEQTERMLNSVEGRVTTVIMYDTDKPLNDSTGLPPVRAIVRHAVNREEVESQDTRKEVQSETEVQSESTDKSVAETSTVVEDEETGRYWETFYQHVMNILILPIVLVVIIAIYQLIKRIKNGK